MFRMMPQTEHSGVTWRVLCRRVVGWEEEGQLGGSHGSSDESELGL